MVGLEIELRLWFKFKYQFLYINLINFDQILIGVEAENSDQKKIVYFDFL